MGCYFGLILFLLWSIVFGLARHTQLQPFGIRNKIPSSHPKLCAARLAGRAAGRLYSGTDIPSLKTLLAVLFLGVRVGLYCSSFCRLPRILGGCRDSSTCSVYHTERDVNERAARSGLPVSLSPASQYGVAETHREWATTANSFVNHTLNRTVFVTR